MFSFIVLPITLYVALSSAVVAATHKHHELPQSHVHMSDSGCNVLSDYLVSVGYPLYHVALHRNQGDHAKLGFCRNDEATQLTCCTNTTETNLHKAAVHIFHNALWSTVDHLHVTFSDSSSYYQDEYLSSVSMASNRTKSVLKDIYHLSNDVVQDCVEGLFIDISSYLRGDDSVDLHGSVLRFYGNIFPVVFQNLLNDPSYVSISSEYRDCLVSCQPNLTPNPFGNVPSDLASKLVRSAQTARQLLTSLATAAELFHLTSKWSMTTPCSESLTQLITCAACWSPASVAKPCRTFCTRVMEGCLAGVDGINAQWSQFVDRLVEIQKQVLHDDLEDLLYVVHMNISESILHAMETTHKYYQEIVSQCGRPSSSSSPSNKVSEFVSNSQAQDRTAVRSIPGLQVQISAVMTTILTSRGIFQRLSVMLCSHEKIVADSETTCWNGTAFASYRPSGDRRRMISANSWPHSSTVKILADMLSQAVKHDQSTSVMRGNGTDLYQTKGVENKLVGKQHHHAHDVHSELNDENDMMADAGYGEYWQNGKKYRRYIDDEMSGSGEGSGDYDVPVKKHRGNKKTSQPDFDFGDNDHRENGNRMSPPYVTTVRPHRPHAGSGVKSVYSVVLLLSTILLHTVVLFQDSLQYYL